LTEILRGHPKKNRFKIIKNRIHQGAMANQYMAIHLCQKEEIVVILDGDDWFFSSETLAVVNQNYQDPDVWITWGSYIEYPSNKIGDCSRPLSDEALCKALHRKNSWGTSHLRTFYAGLFQQIRKKDLEYQGQFVSSCCDLAQMFPMLEMAREKAKFLKEILYVYNCKNPISDFRIHVQERNKIEQHIRALPMYKKIESFR